MTTEQLQKTAENEADKYVEGVTSFIGAPELNLAEGFYNGFIAGYLRRDANLPEVPGDVNDKARKFADDFTERHIKSENSIKYAAKAGYLACYSDLQQQLAEKDDTLAKAIALVDEKEAEIERLKAENERMETHGAKAGDEFSNWLLAKISAWLSNGSPVGGLHPAIDDMLHLFRKETGRG